jgi:hypothetical protein
MEHLHRIQAEAQELIARVFKQAQSAASAPSGGN